MNLFQQSILPKIKFAASGSVATLIDYLLYLFLTTFLFSPVISNIISQGSGMIVNFILQKRYVFVLQRRINHAFLLSIGFSLLGIALGSLLIGLLVTIPFLRENQYLTKLIVTGIIFFYNYYTKKFAFEKRLGSNDKET